MDASHRNSLPAMQPGVPYDACNRPPLHSPEDHDLRNTCLCVTVQNRSERNRVDRKNMLHECGNPIVVDDFHGFPHRNCEGTEQLLRSNKKQVEAIGSKYIKKKTIDRKKEKRTPNVARHIACVPDHFLFYWRMADPKASQGADHYGQ